MLNKHVLFDKFPVFHLSEKYTRGSTANLNLKCCSARLVLKVNCNYGVLSFQDSSGTTEYDTQVPVIYADHGDDRDPIMTPPVGNIQETPRDDDDVPLICPPKQLLPFWPYYLGLCEFVFGFLALGFGKILLIFNSSKLNSVQVVGISKVNLETRA